jgi:hypothetical protein
LEVGDLREGTLDNIRACSRDRPQAVPSPSPRSWLPDCLVIAGHNGNYRNSEGLARCIVPIGMRPTVVSILSVNRLQQQRRPWALLGRCCA